MRNIELGFIAAVVIAATAVPAAAQKASAQKASDKKSEAASKGKSNEIPPGMLIAAQRAAEGAGRGHGDNVPRGKGKGWGHLLHDHTPVSPD